MEKKIKIIKPAKAGSLESNDILIMLSPNENGIEIRIDSIVDKQFGKAIEATVLETLRNEGVSDAMVVVTDKGALDFTIKARVKAAIARGAGEQ